MAHHQADAGGVMGGRQSSPFHWPASFKTYLVLLVLMVILAALQMTLPLQVNQGQQTSWVTIAVVGVLGFAGLYLVPRAGFAVMWSEAVTNRQRFLVPFVTGAGLGLVMVVLDMFRPLGTDIQTQFPDSLVVFTLAGLVEEIVVHLFLTTLLVWLLGAVLLRGRHDGAAFWVVAIGVGVGYWLLQIGAILNFFPEKFSPFLAAQLLFVIAVTITAGAYVFRRSGFLAALALRYGFYLVWHIVWAGGIGVVRYFM